ncbi:unnamed protein product, partial [Rodentolepis nana]|uniref:Non-specific serine/threonine protein kinase n=1 Tax=Rodentolepis nana TaxID=102285 RepID=A0A0R3TST5_RODNA
IPHESSNLSPWTSKRRRFYASSVPIFILPQEEIEIVPIESDNSSGKPTAATFWWQLARLYTSIGRSEEILGWLCDRWTSGSDSTHLLERLGKAILANGSYVHPLMKMNQSPMYQVEWTLRKQIEELLHRLNRLGSWEDLDVYAMDSAKYLGATQEDDFSPSLDEASTSNIHTDELASLWKEPYLADSILPHAVHSRLQICLSSEISRVLSNQLQDTTDKLSQFARIMDACLLSTSQDAEPRYAYELAILSILRNDLSKAQFYCKEAFSYLARTWSSKEDKEECLERVQLTTELKEYLEASSSGPDSDAALKILLSWQERCSAIKCSEEVTNSRLVESENLSLEEQFLPAYIDFRLKCCNDFSRSGNAKRALNILPQLYQLVGKTDKGGKYRRLAWCSAFSRAWMSEYFKNVVYCFEEENLSINLENGLGQCLSSLSQCIDVYDRLKEPSSVKSLDLGIVLFSHAISIAQVLSSFHDLSLSGRLSDASSKRLISSFQPTLKARFVKIHGLQELDKAEDFIQASAFAFFKRCVDLAMGVPWAEDEEWRVPVSAENLLCRRNLMVYKPEEALLEVANFCNSRIDEEIAIQASYAEMFSRSVLTAMRLGSEGGRIRFGRVLQLEWFDRLMMAPLEGGLCLVKNIIRRIAAEFPQGLSLPFRVLLTSFCDWKFVGQSSFEHFMAKLMQEGNGDAATFYSE